jgi:hypothetical protein
MERRAVTRLSPLGTFPIYIAKRYRRMVRHSPSLEEGYSIPLVLRLYHYVYHTACPPLEFDLMLLCTLTKDSPCPKIMAMIT